MRYSSFKIKHYKLFDETVLSNLNLVNVVIGKNNSGKSSLIDAISAAYDAKIHEQIMKERGEIIPYIFLTEHITKNVYNSDPLSIRWKYNDFFKALSEQEIELKIGLNRFRDLSLKFEIISNDPMIQRLKNSIEEEIRRDEESISEFCFRRMRAERNIVPEGVLPDILSDTGEGASNLIRQVLMESKYDEEIVERDLLDALNGIIYPDSEFENIRTQQINEGENGIWEVFLQEKGRQRIALSKMGSGVKTILLILLNLMVWPKLYPQKEYIYAFEEVENNLHPALQRRVFEFLYDYAVKNDVVMFLTTHSHVAINCFYELEKASIYHIEKKENKASLTRIESYFDKAEILSDLDVKASDILQSNGIIWVEGPSDRIYIKCWLELFTDTKFSEGVEYQFLYYGGRMLSHYTGKEEEDNLISILTTNRNAAIVIDSDKKNKQMSINETKKRIRKEFESQNMLCWITKGKEIENYIPVDAIQRLLDNDNIKQCEQYDKFTDYIEDYYSWFKGKKVPFANEITQFLTKENCEKMLDLKSKITELYRCIEKWNR